MTTLNSIIMNTGDTRNISNIINHKKPSISQDKMYFFRTSLFTEKTKKFIQKFSKSNKKIEHKLSEIKSVDPKINNNIYSYLKTKNEKKYCIENKNVIQYKEKMKNNSKSSNNLLEIEKSDNGKSSQKFGKTEEKKDLTHLYNNAQDSKIITDIKKTRLFNGLDNNKNRDKIMKKIIPKNFPKYYLKMDTNFCIVNSGNKNITSKNQLRATDVNNRRIKYKLKVSKHSSNKNIETFKSPTNHHNTFAKKLNNIQIVAKNCKLKAFSIFDENNYRPKFKIGNYHGKNNIRYNSNNIINEDRIHIKKYILSGIYRNML